MLKLFEIDDKYIGKRCGDCTHIERWRCNSKIFFYCGIRISKRTDNGLLKVKCKTPACGMFKKRDGKPEGIWS